jgi:hypothetical protein
MVVVRKDLLRYEIHPAKQSIVYTGIPVIILIVA